MRGRTVLFDLARRAVNIVPALAAKDLGGSFSGRASLARWLPWPGRNYQDAFICCDVCLSRLSRGWCVAGPFPEREDRLAKLPEPLPNSGRGSNDPMAGGVHVATAMDVASCSRRMGLRQHGHGHLLRLGGWTRRRTTRWRLERLAANEVANLSRHHQLQCIRFA